MEIDANAIMDAWMERAAWLFGNNNNALRVMEAAERGGRIAWKQAACCPDKSRLALSSPPRIGSCDNGGG